jgi:hypothetical protein
MTRIAPTQPNEALARIAPRFLVPQPNRKQPNFGPSYEILLVQIQDSKRPAPRRLLISLG